MLFRPQPPWVVTCRKGDDLSLFCTSTDIKDHEISVVEILCENIKKISCFYEVFSDLFQFPEYFGENLNALIDCMEDEKSRDTIPLLVLLSDADDFLREEPADAVHGVLSAFNTIGTRWAEDGGGADWGSPPRGFVVVLEYS